MHLNLLSMHDLAPVCRTGRSAKFVALAKRKSLNFRFDDLPLSFGPHPSRAMSCIHFNLLQILISSFLCVQDLGSLQNLLTPKKY
jgi:hypothetical protein